MKNEIQKNKIFNYVLDYFDNNDIFEEFITNPLYKLNNDDYANLASFMLQYGKDKTLSSIVSDIIRCDILQMYMERNNHKYPNLILQLTDFKSFNYFINQIISHAGIISKETGIEIKEIIKYTFILAGYYFDQSADNVKVYKEVSKKFIKPIGKLFSKECEVIFQEKYLLD